MKATFYSIFVLSLVFFVGCDGDNTTDETPAAPACYLAPGETTISLGEQAEFEIVLQDIPDSLFAMSCQLVYDPAILEFADYDVPAEQGFFGDDVVEFALAEDSIVHIAISRKQDQPMVTGSGVICRLSFEAIAAGNSNLSLPAEQLHFYSQSGDEITIQNLEISSAIVMIP